MARHGSDSSLRAWLMALLGAAALFLGGLVLSYFLWNRIESDTTIPCEESVSVRAESARANLGHAAALLDPQGPELRLTLAHIFQFPFEHACFIPPYTSAQGIQDKLRDLWDCAGLWEQHIASNDAYVSLIAVTASGVVPIALHRTEYDLAAPTMDDLTPESELVLRKRPGSDQVLIRVQPAPRKDPPASQGNAALPPMGD